MNHRAPRASITEEQEELFYEGSTTYYNASRFFPPEVRSQVTILYAFVRKADNFVDSTTPNVAGFERFYQEYREYWKRVQLASVQGKAVQERVPQRASALPIHQQKNNSPAKQDSESQSKADPVILSFVQLMESTGIDPDWVEAFFHSMKLDLVKSVYNSLDEIIHYMYGSAEVIGLCMARIMKLPNDALLGARMLGRAMQYINFIRDIAEDNSFGRCYLPTADQPFASLQESDTRKHPNAFCAFIQSEIRRFVEWQSSAEEAFAYLDFRYRIAIQTASNMYLWTALQIYKNPWIVYTGSIKPSKTRIVLQALGNLIGVKQDFLGRFT